MNPPESFVRDLKAYDPSLKVKWARHRGMWLIGVKARPNQPSYLQERPNPLGSSPRAKDLWELWLEGYLHVMFVHPSLLRWAIVAPYLTKLSLEAHRGAEALIERLEARSSAAQVAAAARARTRAPAALVALEGLAEEAEGVAAGVAAGARRGVRAAGAVTAGWVKSLSYPGEARGVH